MCISAAANSLSLALICRNALFLHVSMRHVGGHLAVYSVGTWDPLLFDSQLLLDIRSVEEVGQLQVKEIGTLTAL